jgi:acetoin utilization protein AcuB
VKLAPRIARGNGARKIGEVMTRSPHTIGQDQPLAVAHAKMRTLRVRHLPVLEGGKLVGLLSQRDLYFIETLSDVSTDDTFVFEAMSVDVFATTPDTPLGEVLRTMFAHAYGSAVVVDHGQVVGIFTTSDAVKLLAECTEYSTRRAS